jgi:hypothetical protein
MSDSDDNKPQGSEKKEEVTSFNPDTPKSKVQGVLEELELFALQKGQQNSIDVNKFTDSQKDKLLEILEKNEDNAFKYHDKRLDALKEIEIKRIDASIVNQRTLKLLIIGLIIAIPAITLLILFFKETFFIPWLTFLTGLVGGVGISKIIPAIYKQPPRENPITENNSE